MIPNVSPPQLFSSKINLLLAVKGVIPNYDITRFTKLSKCYNMSRTHNEDGIRTGFFKKVFGGLKENELSMMDNQNRQERELLMGELSEHFPTRALMLIQAKTGFSLSRKCQGKSLLARFGTCPSTKR
jgi:hypothetical protein